MDCSVHRCNGNDRGTDKREQYVMNDLHEVRAYSDRVALIGELEHLARHSTTAYSESGESHYLDTAGLATEIRRKVMGSMDISDRDWCSAKASASIKQLANELQDPYAIKAADALVNQVWGKILGVEIAGCEACREDK